MGQTDTLVNEQRLSGTILEIFNRIVEAAVEEESLDLSDGKVRAKIKELESLLLSLMVGRENVHN